MMAEIFNVRYKCSQLNDCTKGILKAPFVATELIKNNRAVN